MIVGAATASASTAASISSRAAWTVVAARPLAPFEKLTSLASLDVAGSRQYVTEYYDGSSHAFNFLANKNLPVRRPDLTFATPDHGVSTLSHKLEDIPDLDHSTIGRVLKKTNFVLLI